MDLSSIVIGRLWLLSSASRLMLLLLLFSSLDDPRFCCCKYSNLKLSLLLLLLIQLFTDPTGLLQLLFCSCRVLINSSKLVSLIRGDDVLLKGLLLLVPRPRIKSILWARRSCGCVTMLLPSSLFFSFSLPNIKLYRSFNDFERWNGRCCCCR